MPGTATRRILWYALGGMIFFAVLASGDALHWRGRDICPFICPNIVLSKLPFFANVRTPARAIVFVYLFLGIGIAMAITTALKVRRGAATRSRAGPGGPSRCCCDFFPAHLQTTPMALRTGPCRAAPGTRARTFAVLDLPSGYRELNFYMAQQACHGHPIAQGIIARQSDAHAGRSSGSRKILPSSDRQLTRGTDQIHPAASSAKAGCSNGIHAVDGDLANYRAHYRIASDGPEHDHFRDLLISHGARRTALTLNRTIFIRAPVALARS